MSNAATIKAAREAAGLSAREAAHLVGVTTVTWQRWEGNPAVQRKFRMLTGICLFCWWGRIQSSPFLPARANNHIEGTAYRRP